MINLVGWLKSTTQVPIAQEKQNGKGKNQEEEEEDDDDDDVSCSLDRIRKLKDVIWKTS